MENNENKTLCSTCKDCCCQRLPGAYLPSDVKIADIAPKLLAGEWAIDWWEDDEPLYFLRPATKKGRPIFDPSWGGTCVYLTKKGCKLKFKNRPSTCKVLIPVADTCTLPDEFFKENTAKTWQKSDIDLYGIGQSLK